jgi:hypothetical protein
LRTWPELLNNIVIPITSCIVNGTTYTLRNMSLAVTAPGHAISFNRSGEAFTVPNECVTVMDGTFVEGIESFMTDTLTGACSQSESQTYYPERVNCYGEKLQDSWWLSTLFNNWNASFSHVDRVFERLALGITAHIRRNPGSDYWMFPGRNLSDFPDGPPAVPHFAEGIMRSTAVCVLVDWRWLSFHAALIGLSLIPLAIMVVHETPSRRDGRLPQWKSSLLPLIFHGLSPPPSKTPSPAGPPCEIPLQPKELENLAKETIVEFRSDNGGFRLSRVESTPDNHT